MKKIAILAATLVIVLTGCIVTSVHPFYTPRDLTFRESLLGDWTNRQQAAESWRFEVAKDKAYSLQFISGNSTNVLETHLFQLKGQDFMDFFSGATGDTTPPAIPSHMLL